MTLQVVLEHRLVEAVAAFANGAREVLTDFGELGVSELEIPLLFVLLNAFAGSLVAGLGLFLHVGFGAWVFWHWLDFYLFFLFALLLAAWNPSRRLSNRFQHLPGS